MHAAFRETKFFASLDGLRAIAILMVIWQHGFSGHDQPQGLLGRGYHGVGLFFAISGFLITTLLLRERDRNGRIDYRAFFARRVLRIFPLYYAVLALYIVTVKALGGGGARAALFFDNLPLHAIYLSNWAESGGPFGHAWSLSAEEQFYLVWPWVMISLARHRALFAVIALWLTKLILFRLHLTGIVDGDVFPILAIRKIPDSILVGILLAWGLHHASTYRLARSLIGAPWMPLVAMAWALANLAMEQHEEEWGYVPFAFALVVASVVVREDHFARWLFASPPFRIVGQVSYGMYLFHLLVLSAIARFADDTLPRGSLQRFATATALSFVIAWISHRTFERFFLRMKTRFVR